MALKILNPAEMRQARLSQPRMKRAEVAKQIRATMNDHKNDGLVSNGKAKRLSVGLAYGAK